MVSLVDNTMEATPVLRRAIEALTTSSDARVRSFFDRLKDAIGSGEDPQAVFDAQQPEVTLLAWLLVAAQAGGTAVRKRNVEGQWNQQWFTATSWASTVAGWVGTPAAAMAAASVPTATVPLVGVGTQLSHRHLRLIYDEGITVLHVEPDRRIASWQELPDVDGFIGRLDERFAFVEDDPLMNVMKQAVKNVYLEYLFEMED